MRVEESIVIDRPCEEVFAFLSVRSNDSAWMASVVASEWLDPVAPLNVGRRGRMVMKLFGRTVKNVDEVTAFEPGRRIAHRTIEGSLKLDTACLTEAAGSGCRTTVVAEAERLPGGWIGSAASPLIASLVRRGFRTDLARLKEILETHDAQGAATDGAEEGHTR